MKFNEFITVLSTLLLVASTTSAEPLVIYVTPPADDRPYFLMPMQTVFELSGDMAMVFDRAIGGIVRFGGSYDFEEAYFVGGPTDVPLLQCVFTRETDRTVPFRGYDSVEALTLPFLATQKVSVEGADSIVCSALYPSRFGQWIMRYQWLRNMFFS